MAVAFELMAKIGLDDSEYKGKLSGAKKLFQGFGSAIKTGAKVAAGAFVAVGTAAAAVGTTIVKQTTATARYGDNIDKMSQKMNMSTDAYQEWDAVLQHCGTSIESMQNSMKTLATAAETGNKAFEQLGISQEQIAGMSEEQLFETTISALQGVESETERTYLASKLLGRGATELGPLLNMSAEETDEMRQRVHELGGVMSEDAVKAAAAYSDSLQDMQTAFAGLKNNLFAQFMPGITEVMDGLTEIFAGNTDEGVGMISKGIEGLADKINKAMPKLIEVGGKILRALGKAILDNLPEIFKMGTTILVQLVTGIVEALPELIAAIPEIFAAMGQAFEENWPALKAAGVQLLQALWEGIKSALGWLGEQIATIGDSIKSSLSTKWDAIKNDVSAKWDGIKSKAASVWEAVKTVAVAASSAAGGEVASAWETAKANIQEKVEALKNAISEKFDAMKSKVAGFVSAVKQKLEDFKNKVQAVVEKIKSLFNFNFSTPHIKLPHFEISPPGWKVGDLLQGIKPELSISWYAKAYDNPYMFTKPTLMGFGDGAGGEIVYGHSSLMQDIRTAMGETQNESAGVEQIIALLEEIIRNGVNANFDRSKVYRAMQTENRNRTKATSYNGFALA